MVVTPGVVVVPTIDGVVIPLVVVGPGIEKRKMANVSTFIIIIHFHFQK